MTQETEKDINELVDHLHAARQPDQTLRQLLVDFAQKVESRERTRSLEIVRVAHKRLHAAKGRGWSAELTDAEREVENGSQRLFQI